MECDVNTAKQPGPMPVVVVGSGDVTFPLLENLVNLLGRTTLPELCWLLRRAEFVASVDSGPFCALSTFPLACFWMADAES